MAGSREVGSSPDPSELDIDDRVEHPRFGTGTVVDLDVQKGRPVRIVVEFDNGIERKLPASAFQLIGH